MIRVERFKQQQTQFAADITIDDWGYWFVRRMMRISIPSAIPKVSTLSILVEKVSNEFSNKAPLLTKPPRLKRHFPVG